MPAMLHFFVCFGPILCITHIFARFNVWMASTASPRVSTMRLALSSICTAISRNTNTSVFRSRFVLNEDSWYAQAGKTFLKTICLIHFCFLSELFDLQEHLLEALHDRHHRKVEQFLFKGQCPNFVDRSGVSAPEIALVQKDERSAIVLIRDRADFGLGVSRVATFLHMACHHGLPTVVSELIQSRADINALDVDGDDPLAVAVMTGHLGCTTVLLNHVPPKRLAKRDKDGDSLITLAASSAQNTSIVSLLMRAHWPDGQFDSVLMMLPSLRRFGVLSPVFLQAVPPSTRKGYIILHVANLPAMQLLRVAQASQHLDIWTLLARCTS